MVQYFTLYVSAISCDNGNVKQYAVVRVVSYVLTFLLHGRYGLLMKNQMVSFSMMCHSMAVNVSLVYSFPQIKGLFYLLMEMDVSR